MLKKVRESGDRVPVLILTARSEVDDKVLGLAIAGAIVAAHKGKIAASSRDGRSLTISVTLPAAKLPEAEA